MWLNAIWMILAAACEIAGCYSFWAWLRLDWSWLWLLPGTVCLLLFALLLTWIDSAYAGRAYAAYGGVYIVASLAWLVLIERTAPLLSDYAGILLCLAGAALILAGPGLAGDPP